MLVESILGPTLQSNLGPKPAPVFGPKFGPELEPTFRQKVGPKVGPKFGAIIEQIINPPIQAFVPRAEAVPLPTQAPSSTEVQNTPSKKPDSGPESSDTPDDLVSSPPKTSPAADSPSSSQTPAGSPLNTLPSNAAPSNAAPSNAAPSNASTSKSSPSILSPSIQSTAKPPPSGPSPEVSDSLVTTIPGEDFDNKNSDQRKVDRFYFPYRQSMSPFLGLLVPPNLRIKTALGLMYQIPRTPPLHWEVGAMAVNDGSGHFFFLHKQIYNAHGRVRPFWSLGLDLMALSNEGLATFVNPPNWGLIGLFGIEEVYKSPMSWRVGVGIIAHRTETTIDIHGGYSWSW